MPASSGSPGPSGLPLGQRAVPPLTRKGQTPAPAAPQCCPSRTRAISSQAVLAGAADRVDIEALPSRILRLYGDDWTLMATLSVALVKRQAATPRAVEEAVARQVLHGGDLVSNLLELGGATERDLREVLADVYGLPVLAPGPLPLADPSTLRLVPADMAERYGLVPLEEDDGTLTVAVSEPLGATVVEAIEDALGVTLAQRLALSVRIRQTLARDYGAPLDRRSARLLAVLDGRPDPSPSVRPGMAAAEGERRGRRSSAPPSRAPPPDRRGEFSGSTRLTAELSLRPSSPPPGARPRSRHIGPYASATARVDLRVARTRDEVVGAFFDFIAQYFEYCALFVVHGDLAEGWDAYGPGTDRARISTIGVPLDLPSVLATARDSGTWHLGRLGSSTLDQALARDLGRQPEGLVFVMPIYVRGRCVMLLYGDHGDTDVDPSQLGDVLEFVPELSTALERILLERKRGRASAIPAPRQAGVSSGIPAKLGLAARGQPGDPSGAAEASAVEHATRSPAASPEPEAAVSSPAAIRPEGAKDSESSPPTPEQTLSFESSVAQPPYRHRHLTPAPAAVPMAGPGHKVTLRHAGIAEALRPLRTISINPPRSFLDPEIEIGAEEPELDWELVLPDPAVDGPPRRATPPWGALQSPPPAAPLPEEQEPEVEDLDFEEAIPLTRRPKSVRVPPAEVPAQDEVVTPPSLVAAASGAPPPADSPQAPVCSAMPESKPLDKEEDNASLAVAYSPRAPLPARVLPDVPLPSVIVDVAQDCQALVARVEQGDREAAELLVAIGQPAVASVAGHLPGPVSGGSQAQFGDLRASQCGLLLEVLARIGRPSVPFVAVRTADANPEVRTWATRLLGELPSREAVRSVVPRLSDKNAEVRSAALAATRMLLAHSETREQLCLELEQLTSSALSKVHRLAGVRALLELRHAAAVPVLLALIADGADDIERAAHEALVKVTAQDFGRSETAWQSWWETHRGRHRVEWLIDGLLHESAEIRREAGDELKTLSREYFGYYEDLPIEERAQAQARYREWWETRGKARFT